MDFLGSFHPVILHLPIGGLLAAFLLEVLQSVFRKSTYDHSINVLLGFTAVSALLSALFGFWLAQKGDYQGINFQIHQWAGTGVAILSSIFFVVRSKLNQLFTWVLWSCNLFVLMVAGHFGGSLTHGEDFLITHAPDFIKSTIMNPDVPPDSTNPDSLIVFEDIIQPIIRNKCLSCHNETKKQGNLNLSSAATWMTGGKNGILFDPDKPHHSLLMQRLYLPVEHEEHMPPNGQTQLIPSEVALIEWWLKSGMSYEAKLSSTSFDPLIETVLINKLKPFDPYQALEVDPVSPSLLQALADNGITVLPLSQKSPLLEVNMAGMEKIDDELLLLLLEAKDQIVRLNLQSSGISDDQLKMVGAFTNLIHLSLQNTPISDTGLSHLRDLKYLQYLNVHNTEVSDKSISLILGFDYLNNVFIWNTAISQSAIEKLKVQKPGINLGEI